MKKKLLIIGGGLNGLQSASSAAKQLCRDQRSDEVEIMLINSHDRMTVPPGFLNDQAPETLIILEDFLRALDIRFLQAKAEIIRPENHSVMVRTTGGLRKIHYDFLILASGHQRKEFIFNENTQAFKVDELSGLEHLYNHIGELAERKFANDGDRTLILGGGIVSFPGRIKKLIEDLSLSARIVFRTIIVGKIDKPGWLIMDLPGEVRILSDDEITAVDGTVVSLDSGHRLIGSTLIHTSRYLASPLTRFFNATRDHIGRLKVDPFGLVSNYPDTIAIGFSAYGDANDYPFQDRFAQSGKHAGMNAVRILLGMEPMLKPIKQSKNPGLEISTSGAGLSLSA